MDLRPVWLSVQVSVSATVLTLLVGLPLAWALARRRFPGRDLLDGAVVLPLVLPPTVLGYYLLLVIGRRGPIRPALGSLRIAVAVTRRAARPAAPVGPLPPLVEAGPAGGGAGGRGVGDRVADGCGSTGPPPLLTAVLSLCIRKALPGFVLDASWEVGEGVVALFGPSGAGKTLTLQCLAGLVHPDEGRIVVNGTVFFDREGGVDVPTQKRRLGYVFQGYALFPHLSVADNVGYGLHDRPREERHRRTAEVLDWLRARAPAPPPPPPPSGGPPHPPGPPPAP